MSSLKELADKQDLANKQNLLELFKALISNGYKCYITSRGNWGYIITPDDNILCICPKSGKWDFTFEYRIARENGVGCKCFDEAVLALNIDVVKQAEQEGLAFAKRLKAPLYSSSTEWLQTYFEKDDIIEVVSD